MVDFNKKRTPKPVTIDFETFGIEGRPSYPPKPVGVAIKYHGKKGRYYAWGHPTKNNCTFKEGVAALKKAYAYAEDHDGILCQNGKFDVDVAEVHCGLPVPAWDKIHDTMFQLFLDDPNQKELGLKPSAERILGWAPEEQDAVGDWLITHQPVPGVKISSSKRSEHYFGRYIAYAPGDLVGKYACGDVERTEALHLHLWPKMRDAGMLEAYDRERALMPILLESERQGLPVGVKRLRDDIEKYGDVLRSIEAWIFRRLKIAQGSINLDSGEELVTALVNAGRAADVPRGKGGKYLHNKDVLMSVVTDKPLLGILKYRTQLLTCLRTFMIPWLKTAEASGGKIFTTWNQIKHSGAGGNAGARTGRLSSTPNFQNIPKVFAAIFRHDDPTNKSLPICPFKDLPPLPKVRSYVEPFEGDVLLDRDYSQQEPRILAHFDGGALMQKYLDDPWIDFHDFAREELLKAGLDYPRKKVKNTNLGLIYGMGTGSLAERNDMTVEEAKALKAAVLRLYPGLKAMYQDAKIRAASKEPVRTWGGRLYYCEPPAVVDGRLVTFDYKLPNALIQGSAADCTKEAIIRFHRTRRNKSWKLLLNVHDQITISAPKKQAHEAMACLKAAMESVEFDVPMLSEGAWSEDNWEALVDYDKKGQRLAA